MLTTAVAVLALVALCAAVPEFELWLFDKLVALLVPAVALLTLFDVWLEVPPAVLVCAVDAPTVLEVPPEELTETFELWVELPSWTVAGLDVLPSDVTPDVPALDCVVDTPTVLDVPLEVLTETPELWLELPSWTVAGLDVLPSEVTPEALAKPKPPKNLPKSIKLGKPG